MNGNVKIYNGAIDNVEDLGEIRRILRGVIDRDTFDHLKVDTYQREMLSEKARGDIRRALEDNKFLPDLTLGMRGVGVRNNGNGAFTLSDPVFIIDGQQRIETIKAHFEKYPNRHVGASVLMPTTYDMERRLFIDMGTKQRKVGANIILRNKKEDSDAIATLVGLTNNDRTFALYNRVSWDQHMKRNDIVRGAMYLKVAVALHSNYSGVGSGFGAERITQSLDRAAEHIGIQALRNNVKTFFEIIDKTWGLREIAYREPAVQLKVTFLIALARVFALHDNFWDGKHLSVDRATVAKLKGFRLHDPHVVSLASASGSAQKILYDLIARHINSGKRTRRLEPRDTDDTVVDIETAQPSLIV